MNSTILVTGGTGTLGRLVASRLRDGGHAVRVAGRHAPPPERDIEFARCDFDTGDGVEAALSGVRTVVHCAGAQKGDGDKARRLVAAASRAGVTHLVFISVVGADTIPVVSGFDRAAFGYFASKRDAEEVVAGSGIPFSTLRATQFFELTLLTARAMSKLPVIPVPRGFRFQPVDAGEVADRLVELALGQPAGLVPDLAGPICYPMGDLIRSYLAAAGQRRLLVPVPMAGRAARAIREGANLSEDRAVGRRTWEEFLTEQVPGTVRR
ncbi:SDR family oxidoreductase [Arthrobacter sp. B2a2-09]|uniref:SDR family oxidoreductase n=1 Tax=Arthrobacter sp. B2a2-09 TaxID=2952822 RepID=UPI0022CD59A3|nr:NAD(P)H-binding protein [Arthrobacter sp. B2a2-09]MCZ9880324.1 NAD(P)H-binding protein [Arthrobacter sp. B2a2-09]